MATRVGTANYRSEVEAKKAYGDSFASAIDEGRIAIGKPKLKPGETLLVDKKGRYFIQEPK